MYELWLPATSSLDASTWHVVCVCIHICMYMGMLCVCIYIWIWDLLCVQGTCSVYMHMYMYICICIYTPKYEYTYVYMYMYVHPSVCICTALIVIFFLEYTTGGYVAMILILLMNLVPSQYSLFSFGFRHGADSHFFWISYKKVCGDHFDCVYELVAVKCSSFWCFWFEFCIRGYMAIILSVFIK